MEQQHHEGQKIIITIGREFGSNGHVIGNLLGEKLGIPVYDKRAVQSAMKKQSVTQELLEEVCEKQHKSFLYSLIMASYTFGSRVSTLGDMTMDDKLFLIQSSVIKKLAKEGSCVFVGRCADYVLRDDPDRVSVFIHGTLHDRAKRVAEHYGVSAEEAQDLVNKTDKSRANYYSYYSSQTWGSAENYHLSLSSSMLSEDAAAELIIRFIELSRGDIFQKNA